VNRSASDLTGAGSQLFASGVNSLFPLYLYPAAGHEAARRPTPLTNSARTSVQVLVCAGSAMATTTSPKASARTTSAMSSCSSQRTRTTC